MAAIVDKDNTLDISKVSEGLQKALPSYARPLFIRKLSAVELTGRIEVVMLMKNILKLRLFVLGTYKLKKLDLQKEGFDVELIKDPLYYYSSNVYHELTPEAYQDILAGKIRL